MSNDARIVRSRWRVLLILSLLPLLLLLFLFATPVDAAVVGQQPSRAVTARRRLPPNLPQLAVSQQITATKSDAPTGPTAEPGERITYTIYLTNSGGSDVTGVTISDVIDLHTTLIANSLRVTPLAMADAYDAVGNTRIEITATNGLLANDIDPDDPPPNPPFNDNLSVTGFDATSANGGDVHVNPDGSFTYDPPAGYQGLDGFNYTLQDAQGISDTASVAITVSDMVWYIDNAAPSGGDGRSHSPFNAIPGTVGNAGDIIFIHENGGGNYSASLTLQDDQQLMGQDFGPSDFATVTGLAQPPGAVFPAPGASPTLVSGSAAIMLAADNTLRGLTVGATSGVGLTGTSFGALTIRDMSISGAGAALALDNGAVDALFDVLTVNSVAGNGITLTDVSGNLSATSGSISGVGSLAFDIDGGTVAVTYPGDMSKQALGRLVHVRNRPFGAGPIIFSGNLSCDNSCVGIQVVDNSGGLIAFSGSSKVLNTGANIPVFLNDNAGTTITFSNGGLDIDTTSASGFSAKGGGVVNVTGPANTINTTTGIALDITDTTIGASGVTFQSISSDGATNGIRLSNTGSSAGLTITGDGTLANNASGGTIQNTTSFGIRVTNTLALSLTAIRIQNPLDHAILATALRGTNLLRASTITSFNQPGSDGFRVVNDNANLTELRLDNSTFSNADGNDALAVFAQGNSMMNIVVENQTLFTDLEGDAIDVLAGDVSGSTATVTLTVDDNNFTNAGATGNGGIQARAANAGTLTGSITNNTFNDTHRPLSTAGVIEIQANNNSSVDLTVSGNDLDQFNQSGINVIADDASDATVVIEGNTIDTTSEDRIGIRASIRNTGATRLTIQNNQIGQTTAMPGVTGTRSPIDIEVFSDTGPTDDVRILIENNQLRSNKSSATSEVLDIYIDDNADVQLIVTNNTLVNVGSGDAAEIATDESTLAGTSLCLNLSGNVATDPGPTTADIELIEFAGAYSVADLANVAANNPDANIVFDPSMAAFDSAAGCQAPLTAGLAMGETVVRAAKEPALAAISASETQSAANSRPTAPMVRDAPFTSRLAFLTKDLALPPTRTPAATPGDTINLLSDPFTLPAGRSITMTFAVAVNVPLSASVDSVQNQVIVASNEFDDVLSVDPEPHPAFPPSNGETITPLTVPADLQLEKDDGLTTAAPGQTITYTIVARNNGPNHVTGATVQDTFPAVLNGVSWTCAAASGATCSASGSGDINDTVELPAGSSVTYTAVAQIDLGAAGAVDNMASITATDGTVDPLPANNSSGDSTALAPLVDVALSLTESIDPVVAGSGAGNLTYVLRATNNGPSAASGVVVADTLTLPSGVTVDAIMPSAGTIWNGATGSWTIGDLAPGAVRMLTIALTVSSSATTATDAIANHAAVSAVDQPDVQAANNTVAEATSILGEPGAEDVDLRISKDDDVDPVPAGATLTYTIVVTNAGPADASGVSVSDALPAAFTYVSDTCGGLAGAAAWSWSVGSLPAGQSRTCLLSGLVDENAAGAISNSASVTSVAADTNPSDNATTETTAVTSAGAQRLLYLPFIAKPLVNTPPPVSSGPFPFR